MPAAQRHHPFEGADTFGEAFPADFICEAIDQTRGWFYSLLAVNTLVFDSTPYRNVVCLGHIVDDEGLKMSKSRGNALDPWAIMSTFGADALRWYFFSAGQPWVPRRVSEEGIRESTRQTLLTLWHVYSFHVTYADIDGWSPSDGPAPTPTHVLDRWVLGELDDTVAEVTAALEAFDALGGLDPAGPVRRRPLQLVRASQPAPLLEEQRPGGPRHPARVPRHQRPGCWHRSPRSSPRSSTPPSPGTSRSTWPTGRCQRAASTPPPRPRWPAPAGWWRSVGRRAPTPR